MFNRKKHESILSPYADWNVKRQARIDGELAIPAWDSSQPPQYLHEIYQVGQTTLEGIGQEWEKEDRALHGAWAQATLKKQQAEKDVAEAADREEQAQRRHEEVHGRRLAVPDSKWRKISYGLVLAVVLVCEFPFNAVVFQQLGESYYSTLVMTGTIAACLVLCAHLLGAQLHQPIQGRPLALVWRVVLAVTPFVVILCIAQLRGSHMQEEALSQLSSTQLLLTNLSINCLVFWTLTFYSYKLHDPVAGEVLQAIARRWTAEQRLHLAGQQAAGARIARQKRHNAIFQEARGFVSEVSRRMALYRRDHIRARPDRDQHESHEPAWFQSERELTMPEDLQRVEWGLDAARAQMESYDMPDQFAVRG